jgi:hypothetical protein
MDHAIDSIQTYLEIEMEQLYDEFMTGKYKKLSDCPSYGHVSTYRKAINVMEKFCYGDRFKSMPLKEMIEGHIWVTRSVHVDWKREGK